MRLKLSDMIFRRMAQSFAAVALAATVLLAYALPSRAADSKGDCYVLQDVSSDNWQGPTPVNLSQCAALAGERSESATDGVGKSRWQGLEIQANKDGSYQAFKAGQLEDRGFWSLNRLVEVTIDDIDGFWQREFDARGWNYETPEEVRGYTTRIRTACGRSVPNNAFYCRLSNSIYFDSRLLQQQFDNIGDFAPAVIVAHEWGHSIQAQERDVAAQIHRITQLEQQADCLAGVYVRDASARGEVSQDDVQEASDLISQLPRSRSHGTSAQRLAAFQKGLDGGMDACLG